MEVMERAVELEAAGAQVLHLGLGEPDAPPPPAAVEAASRALAEGRTRYTDSRGLRALREAIAADKERRTGVAVDPDRVLVTSGTSPAMLIVFSLLVEPGDEVVLGAPYYPCYPNFVRLCGGVPIAVPCDPADGFALRAERVKAAIGPRTRAIVVASPANPTGAVQSLASFEELAALGLRVAVPPAGAFYVLADARHVDRDSRRLAFRILEEAHVAVTPGIDFGDAAEGFLRFCYAVSDDTLDTALLRMRRVLAP